MRTFTHRAAALSCAAALAACGGDAPGAHVTRARSTAAGPGPAWLAADVHLGRRPAGSAPHGFAVSAGVAYFAADDGAAGNELWRTDGSSAGTRLVLDLRPGEASSLPAAPARLEAIPFAGGFLFAADDGARGVELWRTDGTAEGTRLVRDLEPGSGSSSPRRLTAAGGTIYFVATTRQHGAELWKTDGTEEGTRLVRDVLEGEVGSEPTELVALGDALLFAADGEGGRELWRSDGSGTTRVKDLVTGGSSDPTSLTAFAGRVYFAARDAAEGPAKLWATDGTAAGTALVANPLGATAPALLTVSGARLYYAATSGGTRDLWSTDGASQTRHTTSGVAPSAIAASGGKVFVAATSAAAGHELHVWTGQALLLLLDAEPGAAGSAPSALTDVSGTLFFRATRGGVPELHRSDGTAQGTSRVVLSSALQAGELAAFGTSALLAADDGANGMELWRSSGSELGTGLVRNIRPDHGGSEPEGLTAWNGSLYFSAEDGVTGRELWRFHPVDGASLLDVFIGSPSSLPADLVDGGARLLFTASDPSFGRELWATDGTEAGTAVLRDLRPGVGSSVLHPAELTRAGASFFFVADDGTGSGRELWKTDGTADGTLLVKDVWPGTESSFPTGLFAAGTSLWFVAEDGESPFPLPFRSDGTPAGTGPAGLLNCIPGEWVTDPAWFAELDGTAVFSASSEGYGRELFRWDPVGGCTRRLRGSGAAAWDSNPTAFTVHAGAGFFGARDDSGRHGLWRTDGTSAGTARVAAVGSLGEGAVSSTVSVGGLLFFVGNDEVHGPELWTSDGTAGGTRMVKDAHPGPLGSMDGSALFPLPARGHVLYAAADGAAGRELWISNGTVLGTRRLQDLRPGAESSNPRAFAAVGELVFFTADDGATGRELWALDVSEAALDLTPPVPLCPAEPVPAEATRPDGASPLFAVEATDLRSEPVTVTYSPAPGSPMPFGITPVTATAVDAAGNVAECTLSLLVQDTTPPTTTCPASLHVEATSPAGAAVSYAATVTDAATISPSVTYAPESGSTFALGPAKSPATAPVTVTATDGAGNTASCSFEVTVADTTAPVATCPPDVTVEPASPAGATATWGDATASDAVSGAAELVIAYDTARGSVFPIGETTVRASATDEAGNEGTCAIGIRVVDTIPPEVTCPTVAPVEATSPAGAAVTFAATATDVATAAPAISYDLQPGGTFPLGTTEVTATATDVGSNTASCSFGVRVVDTTPPAINCPADLTAEATGPGGAAVPFAATASDAATASPAIAYDVAPGSVFALDAPVTVTATARDAGENTASCSFGVLVVDTTPPALVRACPFEVVHEATGPGGAVAVHPADLAADLVTPAGALGYAYSQPSGALQPIGTATVEARVADARGNLSAPCLFSSTVRDTTPPVVTCPADVTAEATGPAGADVAWTDATGVDLVTPAGALAVGYDAFPGLFGLGATTVTATLRDAFENAASCSFVVTVADTTPPTIACPALDPVEATGDGAAAVTFAALASDLVTPAPLLAYDVAPGSAFPIGATAVTATATDAAGNAASCALSVVVRDTTPPELTCPPDQEVTGNGAAVAFPAPSVRDAGTAAPAIASTAQSGDVFPVGTTEVTFTATDGSGNSAACTMRVTVNAPPPSGGGGGCGTAGGAGGAGTAALLGLVALLRARGGRGRREPS